MTGKINNKTFIIVDSFHRNVHSIYRNVKWKLIIGFSVFVHSLSFNPGYCFIFIVINLNSIQFQIFSSKSTSTVKLFTTQSKQQSNIIRSFSFRFNLQTKNFSNSKMNLLAKIPLTIGISIFQYVVSKFIFIFI